MVDISHNVKKITRDVEGEVISYNEWDKFHRVQDGNGNIFTIDLLCSGEFNDANELIGRRLFIKEAVPLNFLGVNMAILPEKVEAQKVEQEEMEFCLE